MAPPLVYCYCSVSPHALVHQSTPFGCTHLEAVYAALALRRIKTAADEGMQPQSSGKHLEGIVGVVRTLMGSLLIQ